MCYKTTCTKCRKPTWRGCGAHIEIVLAMIPKPDRCNCNETVTNTFSPQPTRMAMRSQAKSVPGQKASLKTSAAMSKRAPDIIETDRYSAKYVPNNDIQTVYVDPTWKSEQAVYLSGNIANRQLAPEENSSINQSAQDSPIVKNMQSKPTTSKSDKYNDIQYQEK